MIKVALLVQLLLLPDLFRLWVVVIKGRLKRSLSHGILMFHCGGNVILEDGSGQVSRLIWRYDAG